MSGISQAANPALGAEEPGHVKELFANLSSETLQEVKSRIGRGDLAFLPSQVKFEKGRIHFGQGIGWIPSPGLDPAKIPLDNFEVLYLYRKGLAWTVEVKLYSSKPDEISSDFGGMGFAKAIVTLIAGASVPDGNNGKLNPDEAIDNVIMALAVMIEQAPEFATPSSLRKASETLAKRLHGHLKLARSSFEKTGIHPIDRMMDRVGPKPEGPLN